MTKQNPLCLPKPGVLSNEQSMLIYSTLFPSIAMRNALSHAMLPRNCSLSLSIKCSYGGRSG